MRYCTVVRHSICPDSGQYVNYVLYGTVKFISILQPIIKSGKNHYACCRGIFSTPSIDIRGDTKSESKILFGRFSSLILNNLIKDWIRNSEFRFREGLMNTKKRSYYSDLKSLIRNS